MEDRDSKPVSTADDSPAAARDDANPRDLGPAPRWAVVDIFLLLAIAGLAFAREFLLPVVLALLLTLVFSPVRRFLNRWRISSALSAVAIVGMLVGLLVASALILAKPVSKLIEDAPRIGRELEAKLFSLRGSASAVIEAGEKITELASAPKNTSTPEVVVREPGGFFATVASIAPTVLAQIVFTLVLLLFLLASGDMLYEKIVHVMPTFKDKRRAVSIAYDIERKLSHYLGAITLINACLGVAIGTSMWLLGVPNALLLGLIGFAANFVPYIGALFGTLITAVVGLVAFDDVWSGLLPAAVYFALTTIEGQLVTPALVGRRLELNTVVVFLSVAFWAWLWSIVGMLVAVPLLVAARTFCEHIPQLNSVGDFLSARGAVTNEENDAGSSQQGAAAT
jgi:predicted PurR-regulated permease PerM